MPMQSVTVRKHMRFSGARLHERFRVIEHQRRFDPSLTLALLRGESDIPCVAYVVRNAVEREYCERFACNFWDTIQRRGSSRQDDGFVNVEQVGATQHNSRAAQYLENVSRCRTEVEALFEGLGDTGREQFLRERFFSALLAEDGLAFRPAAHQGVSVAACAARSWKNLGTYSLEPHEDRAQLRLARTDGFEIGQASGPLTAVVTVTDHYRGGELVIWDWAPDDAAREPLGVLTAGYPYPHEVVEQFPRIELATRAGDLVLLRSDFIHAVNQTSEPGRLTVSRFIGRSGPQQVVYWT
jgi:uncharacterized membrane protein